MKSLKNKINPFFIGAVGLLFLSMICTSEFWNISDALYLNTKVHFFSNIQDGQVVQRPGKGALLIRLSGKIGLLARSLQSVIVAAPSNHISENDWKELDSSPTGTNFSGEVLAFPGWQKIYLRSKGALGYRIMDDIEMGVGEVFIVAGQSNAAGASADLFMTESTHVRSAYLDRGGHVRWKRGDDPQIQGGGGSVWPLVGDRLQKELQVPIGFINVAVGSTKIKQWEAGSKNFKGLMNAIKSAEPYGVRAVLWQQGESDIGTTTEEYYNQLAVIIKETQSLSHSKTKIPWLVATSSYYPVGLWEPVRIAQQKICQDGLAFEGPDTDSLGLEYRQERPVSEAVHYNEAGLREAANLWYQKIMKAFFIQK